MRAISKWLLWLTCILVLTAPGCGSDKEDEGGKTPEPPVVVVPEAIDEVVIYEAYPGMFGTSNMFAAITARLDDIKALGVNVLWLMPVFEQGSLNAIGSPYCVRDYKGLNARYGTLDELKTLVDRAHDKGMRVIFDWIANHTSWDNAWITQHPDWYTQDANGNIISPPGQNWTDVADLNFSNTAMRVAMVDAMKYWVTEVDIDGYRCDYADGVPTDFWSDAITQLRALKGDDLLMLAESNQTSFLNAGFDMIYGWNFVSRLRAVYRETSPPNVSTLYTSHTSEYEGLGEGKHRMRHITNHDINSEESLLSMYRSQAGAVSAYVIAATMGGCPMIYSSQEIGYDRTTPFFSNYTMDWAQNANIRSEYRKIMSVRASSNALQASGSLTTYNVGERVACYKRSDGKQDVLVAVNTSASTQSVRLPADFQLVKATDLMSGTSFTTTTTLSLDGYGYVIWELAE